METPGQRLTRQFWSVCAVILIIGALDGISHALAVAVVLGALAWWAVLRVMRAVARAQQPPLRRR